MTRAILLVAAALGLFAGAAARADAVIRADSVGTLQVNGTFGTKFDRVECPTGTAVTTACHSSVTVFPVIFPGLGEVTVSHTLVLENFGSACMQIHGQIPIVVAGKGEIDLAAGSAGCVTPEQLGAQGFSLPFIVSGGTGRYAGATGSGLWSYRNHDQTGPESGSSNVTWAGTLSVNGVTFDMTSPVIAGATSKVVKTRLAKGARVTYSVTATDATDGTVANACLPKSGSLFSVGRTTVTCTPTDSSGNSTLARFTITVKRVH